MATGRIHIDAGAEQALRNDKSLLPAGITRTEGNFQPGEVVEILGARQDKLGVGVVELSSAELEAIVNGRQPAGRSQEAIHKDRLLMI